MVGAVTVVPSRKLVAIHRTFLIPGGSGKAPVQPAKKSLGPVAGGAVRLAAAGPVLAITEGIETGLSVMQATGIPTWAALSASGLEALILPPLPIAAEVVIFADNDVNGRGQKAAETLARRASAEGRRVRIELPPTPGTDFNDFFREAVR
jgi:phage/plasmid primase-like uncharacterized protein